MAEWLVDAALLLTGLEAGWLASRGRRDLLTTLAAGAALMLAVRLALAGAGPAWLALCLLASLAAHVFDLRRRWR